MIDFLKKHKKLSVILGIAATLLLVFTYLYALFLPGVWHNGAFLYKKDDGSFSGANEYADFVMIREKQGSITEISFKVNDKAKSYRVVQEENSPNVQIFENGESVFKGTVLPMENLNLLEDENGELVDIVRISVGGAVPEEEELFPNLTELYNLSEGKTDTRGEPYMLIFIVILGAILALDIAFPDLFFYFRHGLNVDGGTPSDYYRAGQRFGRVVCAVGVIVCVVMTFTAR